MQEFLAKNDKIDVRYSSELASYDIYLLVTERGDFELAKDRLDIFTDVSNFERIAGLSYQVTRELRGMRQHRISLKCGKCIEKDSIRKMFDQTFTRVGNH